MLIINKIFVLVHILSYKSPPTISVVHFKVHHIDEESGSENEDFVVDTDPLVVVDDEVVCVCERLLEAPHPLLGDGGHLGAVSVHGSERHIITAGEVATRTTDFQNLIANAVKNMIDRVPPCCSFPDSSNGFPLH